MCADRSLAVEPLLRWPEYQRTGLAPLVHWPVEHGRIAGGTSQVQRTIIGELLLGLPKEPRPA